MRPTDPSSTHQELMQRAIAAARSAAQRGWPNPTVGCVIVRDGHILSTGATEPPPGRHAEIMALAGCTAASAHRADLYVTLEPCCHHGRTPPCTDALIAAGVARVFVGTLDPNPAVSGGGVRALRAAGIKVTVGICEQACRELHSAFLRRFAG